MENIMEEQAAKIFPLPKPKPKHKAKSSKHKGTISKSKHLLLTPTEKIQLHNQMLAATIDHTALPQAVSAKNAPVHNIYGAQHIPIHSSIQNSPIQSSTQNNPIQGNFGQQYGTFSPDNMYGLVGLPQVQEHFEPEGELEEESEEEEHFVPIHKHRKHFHKKHRHENKETEQVFDLGKGK